MRTLETIALVFLLLIVLAGSAFSPWWMLPLNIICGSYLTKEVLMALTRIWSPKLALEMDREEFDEC